MGTVVEFEAYRYQKRLEALKPRPVQFVYQCNCGSQAFFMTQDGGIHCWRCEVEQGGIRHFDPDEIEFLEDDDDDHDVL